MEFNARTIAGRSEIYQLIWKESEKWIEMTDQDLFAKVIQVHPFVNTVDITRDKCLRYLFMYYISKFTH